jgi:hypothetical protein
MSDMTFPRVETKAPHLHLNDTPTRLRRTFSSGLPSSVGANVLAEPKPLPCLDVRNLLRAFRNTECGNSIGLENANLTPERFEALA